MLESGDASGDGYLFEILLPIYDNSGTELGEAAFGPTRRELTERFGGLTAHLRAPARGVWQSQDGEVQRDDVVIFEVMSGSIDTAWWSGYRARLEERFRQEVVLIRATKVTII